MSPFLAPRLIFLRVAICGFAFAHIATAQKWIRDQGFAPKFVFEQENASGITRIATPAHLVGVDVEDRGLFIGSFNRVSGIGRDGTARILPDGSLDVSFDPGPIDPAFALRDGGAILKLRAESESPSFEWRRLTREGDIIIDPNLNDLPANAGTRFWGESIEGMLLVSFYGPDPSISTSGKLAWLNPDGSILRILNSPLLPPSLVTPRVGLPYLSYPLQQVLVLTDGRILALGGLTDAADQPILAPVRLTTSGDIERIFSEVFSQEDSTDRLRFLPDGGFLTDNFGNNRDWDAPRYTRYLPSGERDSNFVPPSHQLLSKILSDGRFIGDNALYSVDGWKENGFNLAAESDFGPSINQALIDSMGRLWLTSNSLRSDNPDESTSVARFYEETFQGIAGISPSVSIVEGSAVWLNVTPGSSEFSTVQWYHDGVAIPGADQLRLTLPHTIARDEGIYYAEVSFGSANFKSNPVKLELAPNTTRIRNFSARSLARPDHPQIGGFINMSSGARPVLIRAVGRGIGGYLPNYMPNDFIQRPQITLFNGEPRILNRNIGGLFDPDVEARTAAVGAFSGRPPFPIYDPNVIYGSALALNLSAGPHSVHVNPDDEKDGLSLFELYDAVPDDTRAFRNVSLRAWSSRGNEVMIGGFILQGNGPTPILIRAVGPTLGNFGVSPVVRDPKLKLFGSGGVEITENDDWENTDQMRATVAKLQAFELPKGSKDAALLVWLYPGPYTAMVDIGDGEPAEALLEIYWVDPN